MPDEKILKRIQRLLAMSNDASSPNEAAIAARRAEALMREHNITEADTILKDLSDDDIVAQGAATGYKTLPEWQAILSVQVAKLMDCDCRAYVDSRNRRTVTFLGQREDAQVAAWIFEYLVDTIQRLSKKYRARMRREKGGAGHGTNMNLYRHGLMRSICETIDEMMAEKAAELKKSAPGTALVVAKQALIEQKFGQTDYGDSKGQKIDDPDAYLDGRVHGKDVRINPAIGADQAAERLK